MFAPRAVYDLSYGEASSAGCQRVRPAKGVEQPATRELLRGVRKLRNEGSPGAPYKGEPRGQGVARMPNLHYSGDTAHYSA